MYKKKTRTRTSNALRILEGVTGRAPALRREIAAIRVQATVGQLIYEARTQAGLTQRELAELIGTKQPVIARLEDADYEGHSLSMLQKIAQALHRRVEIRLPPAEPSLQPA